jgi:hypothetical protein
MPRQELVLQTPTSSGLTPAYSTPTVNGFYVSTNGNTLVHVKNANAASCVVTLPVASTIDGNAVASKTITIPTGQERFIRLQREYLQPESSADAGRAYMDFSIQTSVTAAAFT